MSKLAINGGLKVRVSLLPSQNTIGSEEKAAVAAVLDRGILTGYQGSWGPQFYGGPEIQNLEAEWAERFGAKHAIACNSATSGLLIAMGALTQGDEFPYPHKVGRALVTPYSMTCSATIPLAYNYWPAFMDIEEDFYCVDINGQSDKPRAFSEYNPVMIAVDLFGQPFDADSFTEARKRGLRIVEDAAQALGSTYNGKYAGTLGDIGVFSLNQGKHLTCGEGGIIVTDDDELSMKCRLIMNHAEAVMNEMWTDDFIGKSGPDAGIPMAYKNLHGFNLRMTEMQAAIARVQLRKFDDLLRARIENVHNLAHKLSGIPAMTGPKIRENATHTFYVMPYEWHSDMADGIHRDKFIEAVKAELSPCEGREWEGVPIGCGYIKPIQMMPLFDMPEHITPVCTRKWRDELIVIHRLIGPNADEQSLQDVANAFEKVWENRGELK